MNFFLSISFNMCFGCSKEPSHRDGPFEYSQHMFWLRNKKNIFFYFIRLTRRLNHQVFMIYENLAIFSSKKHNFFPRIIIRTTSIKEIVMIESR